MSVLRVDYVGRQCPIVFQVNSFEVIHPFVVHYEQNHCQLNFSQSQRLFERFKRFFKLYQPIFLEYLWLFLRSAECHLIFLITVLCFLFYRGLAGAQIAQGKSHHKVSELNVALVYNLSRFFDYSLEMQPVFEIKLFVITLGLGRLKLPLNFNVALACFLAQLQELVFIVTVCDYFFSKNIIDWILLHIITNYRRQSQTPMMMNTRAAIALQNQRFRNKLEASMPHYAYEVLMLEIIVEDDLYPRKPTIEEISRLIQLYMLAVEVLESSADTRYDYFKRKIHSLMMKKHIVETMHQATGKPVTSTTFEECERIQLQNRKNLHQAQVYFNKTDNSKVQEILKKAELQVKTLNNNLKKNIVSQEQKLEERIKNRKMKSESGSVSKFKIGAHNAQIKDQDTPPRPNKIDPRMEYFEDYGGQNEVKVTATAKNIRAQYGSVQKGELSRKIRDFI